MIDDKEEIRCGYKVTKKEKRIWNKQLGILSELERVCKKYDIQYFAVCGTLLGAIRHKGFIPWDDDMDVGLLRDDYNKLVEHADEFRTPYFLQNIYTDTECFSHTSRLRDSNTTAIVLKDKRNKCNHGIYIDIFPFDNLVDNRIHRFIQFIGLTFYSRVLQYSKSYELDKNKSLKYRMCNFYTNINGFKEVFSKYQDLCSRYNNRQTKLLGLISGNKMSKQFRYPFVACQEVIEVPFEDTTICVPKGYHDCLTVNYGNYMSFPPEEERGKWHEGVLLIDPDVDYLTTQRNNEWI